MDLTLIVSLLAFFFAQLSLLMLLFRRLNREKRVLHHNLQAYFEPQGGKRDQPSEFDKLVHILAANIGGYVAQSLKSSAMGSASVEAKMTKRMEGAITADIAGQQPGIMGIIAKLPQVQGLISKNADYLKVAQSLLGKPAPGASEDSTPAGDNGGDYQVDRY